MDRFITNVQVTEFLKDYTENSKTVLLEEGAERNELYKIAKAKGMDIKNSRDLGVFKTIYAFTNEANANGAILPKKEILRVLPQIIGKPININHERRFVVGHYIDYRYKQKEDMIIAYAVYYKSYYEDLWNEANDLFKSKQLSTSFEMWSPKDKRKENKDGSYELRSIEIAGGALIYEDDDNQPAFKNAKVLMMAKEKKENNLELVYASKYKEDELIVCNKTTCQVITAGSEISCSCPKCGTTAKSSTHCNEMKCPKCGTLMRRADRPGTGNPSDSPNASDNRIKCSNCEEIFESVELVNIKCPKCYAILNKEGVMQYPPQIKDFKIMCPGCNVNNWLIVSKTADTAKLRCMACAKEYDIEFQKRNLKGIANKMSFVYTGSVTCYQCHTRIPIEGTSKLNNRTVKCPKCGLTFAVDTYRETFKKISKIEEIKQDKLAKSSDKGGKPMDKKEIVEKAEEQKEETKKEVVETPKAEETPKAVEVPVEEKPEEPKVEETPEAPKAEEKPVADETPKAEEEPVEPKAEEPKPEEVPEEKPAETEVNVEKTEEELKQLEEDVETAKKEKVKSLVDHYNATLKKALAKIRTIRKESKQTVASASEKETLLKAGIKKVVKQYVDYKQDAEKQIELYKSHARTLIERRSIVGDCLTDEELMNDDKFNLAKLELEHAKVTANTQTADEIVGAKKQDKGYYTKMKKKINEVAFGKTA